MNDIEYKEAFGIDPFEKERVEKALDYALDIRKFEIDLYWKRATYFWTLIASAFAAHFIILNAQHMSDKNFIAFIVSCVGFLFTFAWLQANRGSKQWQENWENHVDILEDKVIGPLYKTKLSRGENIDGWFTDYITGPAKISVSKTNQIVNLFTLVIWASLAWNVINPFAYEYPISWKHIFISFITFCTCTLIIWKGKTDNCEYIHVATLRKSGIGEQNSEPVANPS